MSKLIIDSDPEQYLSKFGILNKKKSQNLYRAILSKYRIPMNEKEHYHFKEYQERMFNLIEHLREFPTYIQLVFDHLNKQHDYIQIGDVIIMLWCLPRTNEYLSKKNYNHHYQMNIQNYGHLLTKYIEHDIMKNFCIESLTKTNSVPVHCIDYIWFYMNGISFDFSFHNYANCFHINFELPEDNGEFMKFGFNMEYLLEIGLGNVVYDNDPCKKGSFKKFLMNFITNFDLVKKLLTIPSKHNYRNQVINIYKDLTKYFGSEISEIIDSSEIIELLGEIDKN